MNDPDAKLRSVVFAEIERLKQAEARGHTSQQNMLLGAFVDAALSNTQRTRAELAQTLRMDAELLDAVLDGFLGADQIGDPILVDIAEALDYEPNVLRVLLGRPIEPARNARTLK